MSDQATKTLKTALASASDLYYRLVLLVGESGSGKTKALVELSANLKCPLINLNLELSSRLLELAPRERSASKLLDIMRQIVELGNEPVLLDNIEILFDCSLRLDPLKLLQGLSRNRTILAAWNGSNSKRRLKYAESGHPEYRNYETVDAMIINMDELAKANL